MYQRKWTIKWGNMELIKGIGEIENRNKKIKGIRF